MDGSGGNALTAFLSAVAMLAWLVVAVAAAMGMSVTVMAAMAAHLYITAAAAVNTTDSTTF